MGRLLGYARVSRRDQDPTLQLDALVAGGCQRVWVDRASGALDHRPELEKVLDELRQGDALVVWRLDRLGRSVRHLVDTVTSLGDRGVGFRSLSEALDSTTPGGRLLFHVFAAVAEFERDLVRDRTRAGLDAAGSRGRRGGRPRAMTDQQVELAHKLQEAGEHSPTELAKLLGVTRPTLYRYLTASQPVGECAS